MLLLFQVFVHIFVWLQVLGMPLYGRTFTLKGTESGIHADAVGAGGNAGPFTRLRGILGYNEVNYLLKL